MTGHAVVITGGGPTGMMLAGELALAGVDVAIVERRVSQDLTGSRAGGLHARTIEVLDQRGIADRFLAEGQTAQIGSFARVRLDISAFPTRHSYGLALWQTHIERLMAGWVNDGSRRRPQSYPGQALCFLDGVNPSGNYTLTVTDFVGGDSGMVDAWSITVEGEGGRFSSCGGTDSGGHHGIGSLRKTIGIEPPGKHPAH